jgi:Uma2 family endonuclease
MATTARGLTYDDLETIPQEREGDRHELIDGELIVTPPPATNHQTVSSNLVYALEQIARQQRLGRVYSAPTGVRLAPGNVLVPDVIFIRQDRLHIIGPRTIDAAPDLIVEILSPGTRRRDLETKRDLYTRFGVQECWRVDPEARTVTALMLSGDRYQAVPAAEGGEIVSRVLPGLTLTLDDVFAGPGA